MKKFLTIIWICVTVIVFQLTESGAGPKAWKIGHVRPEGSAIDKDINTFSEAVRQGTEGAIVFDIYPANKLGDYSVVQERVSFGEVDMYVGPFGTAVDKRLMLAFAPFLVENWQEARQLYSPGSTLMKHMEGFLAAQNIKLIGGWPVYFGGIALTEKPEAPGDPDVNKRMIIRVPPIKSFEITARSLGYTPYPITWMYAKMGLKTGMVKGMIGGGAEGYKGLKGLVRYYVPVKDHFEYWFVYMNLDSWKGLSEKQQNVIVDAAREMEAARYDIAEAEEQKNIAALEDVGIDVFEIGADEYDKMRDKVRETVWPQLRKDIGQPFDEVLQSIDKQ